MSDLWTYSETLDRPSGWTCELVEGYTEATLQLLPDESAVYVVRDEHGNKRPPMPKKITNAEKP